MKATSSKDIALLVLRLSGLGLAFAHGWPKVARFMSGEGAGFIAGVEQMGFPMPVVFAWAAAISELVGGFAIAFGLFTRISALFAAITMFVAAFFRHRLFEHVLIFLGLMTVDPEVVSGWGNPERAAVYLLVFIALVFLGGGRLSLDGLVRKRKG